MSKVSGKSSGAGLTVVEVMVAIVILGLISTAVLRLVATADRLRGRAAQVLAATRAAGNEFQRIRLLVSRDLPVNDTAYMESSNGAEFEVRRRIIPKREFEVVSWPDTALTKTIAIEVTSGLQETPLVAFRVLVGREKYPE